jgi:hypothetical protein
MCQYATAAPHWAPEQTRTSARVFVCSTLSDPEKTLVSFQNGRSLTICVSKILAFFFPILSLFKEILLQHPQPKLTLA